MTRIGRIAAATLAGTLALVWPAGGQEIVLQGRATSVAREQEALREARVQAAEARSRSARLEAQAGKAREAAEQARIRAAALAARIQESEADIRAGEARLALLSRMTARQSARLAARQEPIVRLTAALQSLSRRPPMLALIQPGSIGDAVHVRAVLGVALPEIQRRTADLRRELERSRELRAMNAQAMRAMQASRAALASRQQELRRVEQERRLAARGLASDATLEAERAIAMGEKARDIVDLMDEVENAGEMRDALAALPGPQPRPERPGATAAPANDVRVQPQRTPAYRLPVVGALVTGMGEISGSGVRSRGLTLAAQPQAQVIAPAAGQVAYAGPYRGYGQIVIIDHGQGWTSLVTGLGRLSTGAGRRLAQGEPIGNARNTDPSVTVELRRQGRPVDIVTMMGAR